MTQSKAGHMAVRKIQGGKSANGGNQESKQFKEKSKERCKIEADEIRY